MSPFFRNLTPALYVLAHVALSTAPAAISADPFAILFPLWAVQPSPKQHPARWTIPIHGVALLPSGSTRTKQRWWQRAVLSVAEKLSWGDKGREERSRERLLLAMSTVAPGYAIEGVGISRIPDIDTLSDDMENGSGDPYVWVNEHDARQQWTSASGAFHMSYTADLHPLSAFHPGATLPIAVRLENSTRLHTSQIQLIGQHGYSIISDVDDTVRDTRVLRKREALRRTVMEEFVAVPGMKELFRDLSKRLVMTMPGKRNGAGTQRITEVPFHFLSATPFDILPSVFKFLTTHFSKTSTFLPSDKRIQDIAGHLTHDLRHFKSNGTQFIAKDFPKRRFFLFGDSGQRDPEGYADVMRKEIAQLLFQNPAVSPATAYSWTPRVPTWLAKRQFRCVFIREITGQNPDAEVERNAESRFFNAFMNVNPINPHTWRVFQSPDELTHVPFESGSCYAPGERNQWYDRIMAWKEVQENLRAEEEEREAEVAEAKRRVAAARDEYKQTKRKTRTARRGMRKKRVVFDAMLDVSQ